jgi:hypothetical protein
VIRFSRTVTGMLAHEASLCGSCPGSCQSISWRRMVKDRLAGQGRKVLDRYRVPQRQLPTASQRSDVGKLAYLRDQRLSTMKRSCQGH